MKEILKTWKEFESAEKVKKKQRILPKNEYKIELIDEIVGKKKNNFL